MAACTPTPTLTLFTTVTSTIVVTTFSASVQTLPGATSTFLSTSCLSTVSGACVSSTVINGVTVIPGGVSTISVPLVITSIITEVNPISTLFTSQCSSSSSSSSSSPILSTTRSSSQSSVTPTTFLVTTTPPPTVVTQETSSTLDNGVVTLVTLTSTSTPPPSVVLLTTSIGAFSQPPPSQSQGSKSSSSIVPIVGGAIGGVVCVIGVVVIIWFILRKCRGSSDEDEDDIVFPYPVTRDRGHAQQLDLSHEPRPYVYGLVGRPTHDDTGRAPQTSLSLSRSSDGRPDSATSLIGASSGLTSMTMAGAGGILSSIPGAQSKGGEVGRQASQSSTGHLPPGAASPATYLGSSSSGSDPIPGSSRYPLQVVGPPSIRSSFPGETADNFNSSGKAPLVVSESGGQSTRAEKKSAPPPLPEGDMIIHSDGGRLPESDHGLLASGSEPKIPAQPEISHPDAPPAYVA